MGKKHTVSVTYENESISIKKQLTSLLCGPRADLWPFYGFFSPGQGFWVYGIPGHFNSGIWYFLVKIWV